MRTLNASAIRRLKDYTMQKTGEHAHAVFARLTLFVPEVVINAARSVLAERTERIHVFLAVPPSS